MTYLQSAFTNHQLLQSPIAITIANGTSIQAIREGSVQLKVAIHGGICDVVLRQVLHVPNLAGSLISVSQLQDQGILMQTTSNKEIILELHGKAIGRAIRIGKTYALASTLDTGNVAYYAETGDRNLVWHRRFC